MIRLILAICAFIELSHEQCGPPYGDQYATAANPYVYILPPLDFSSGAFCVGNYDASAYTDDPGRGFGNLMLEKWKCDGQNGTLTIRNKNNPDQIFKTITDNVVDLTFITSQNIIIEWRQNGTTPCSFSGNLTRANSVFGQVTTPRPTTVPYPTHSNWNNSLGIDPWLITHDLMIGIDSGNKSDDNKWAKTLIFVSFIENQLNILGGTPAYKNEKAYTRITLMQLTPMGNFDTHGPIWEMDTDDFNTVLGSLQYTKSGLAKYTPGMIDASQEAFTIYGNGKNFSATRSHTQRTFLLITDSLPVDTSFFASPTISGSVAEEFQKTDTHLLVIGFGTFDDSLYRENNGSWFTYVQVDDANQKTAAMQVVQLLTRPDPFCFTSSSQWGNIMLKTGEPIVIKEPYYYYSGPPVNGKKQWGAKDGQKYRYCNFQNSVAVIQNSNYANPSTPDGPTGQPYAPMCLMIFHELEVEFDYVKVYRGSELDPDQEIGYFTGLEVTGSYLEIPYSDSITIEFRTNNREVFGGFYLTVKAEECRTFTTPSSG